MVTTDAEPPEITCSNPPSQNTDAELPTADVTWTTPTVIDNCGEVTITSDYESGDSFPIGSTAVTYEATDSSGISNTCSFSIVVIGNKRMIEISYIRMQLPLQYLNIINVDFLRISHEITIMTFVCSTG